MNIFFAAKLFLHKNTHAGSLPLFAIRCIAIWAILSIAPCHIQTPIHAEPNPPLRGQEREQGTEPHHQSQPYFVPNGGQWQDVVQYRLQTTNASLFVEKNALTWLLLSPDDRNMLHECHHHPQQQRCNPEQMRIRAHAFKMVFETNANTENSSNSTQWQGTCASTAYTNFFIGNNPQKWASNLPMYAQIQHNNLFEGVECKFFTDRNGSLKYEFQVQAHADASKIAWHYVGIDPPQLDAQGNLQINTTVNQIIDQAPIAYQLIDGQEIRIPCHFAIQGKRVSFVFPEGYNQDYPLTIDPSIVFATYSGSTGDNWGTTATYDDAGFAYAGSSAFASGYPTTTGAFDISFNNAPSANFETDIALTKFSPDGSSLIYSTYLGGQDTELAHSLIVTPSGELIVLGTTSSDNFPAVNGYDNSYNGGLITTINAINFDNGSDIIVAKLSSDGTALIASTYLGGSGNDGLNESSLKFNYADEARGEVFLDNQNNVYIASCSRSNNFPTVNAQQAIKAGLLDACIVKLSPDLNAILWSTYLGGTSDDAAYSIKIDGDGSVFVCGGTRGGNFPATQGVYDNSFNGQTDAFIAKYSNNGNLQAATFLGTSSYDQSFFIDFDKSQNRVYTVGQTEGNYPISQGVYSNANSGQYIHCLSNDLATSIFSTRFGSGNGGPNLSPTAFLVDRCNRIYVSGWGSAGFDVAPTFGLSNMPLTPDAFQGATDNGFYFILLGEDAETLEYATHFGGFGPTSEHVDGGTSRFDKKGFIYQAVCAGCGASSAFPTTSGAWSNTNNSNNCNLGLIKFNFEPPITIASAIITPGSSGCVPFTVTFGNGSINSTETSWYIDDVFITQVPDFTHTFTQTGSYNVTLIAQNDETCNRADTTITTITVLNPLSYNANFNYQIDCSTYSVTFTPNETVGNHIWQFGDGATSNEPIPTHTYPTTGIYDVTHIIASNIPNCPATDTVSQSIEIVEPVTANASASDTLGCIPLGVQLSHQSTNATSILWNLGNGQTSTAPNPTVNYPIQGEYWVSLIAQNPQSCNLSDTARILITTLDTIIFAQFAPQLPEVCAPLNVTFNTPLPAALNYHWDFGDGTTAGDIIPATHLYEQPGTYTATMIASSPCAPPDTAQVTFLLPEPPMVEVGILAPPQSGCTPVAVFLQATGNAVTYSWNMGNGITANGTSVSQVYDTPGSYHIQLFGTDSSTCNITDSASVLLEVYPYAVAYFTTNTDTAEANYPIQFNNQSTNANSYLWNFGDGTTSTEISPQHTYAAAGQYDVCLQAITNHGCNDVYCQTVTVLPEIKIGIPNAFSPNNDNINDFLQVEGNKNIALIDLKIFNRWGELLFQTNNPQTTWDGTYKGQEQEMEVYVYTMSAILVSSRQISLQGNITLIR